MQKYIGPRMSCKSILDNDGNLMIDLGEIRMNNELIHILLLASLTLKLFAISCCCFALAAML